MTKYNLSGSRKFYGQTDPVTYFNVPEHKLLPSIYYILDDNPSIDVIFIYNSKTRQYLGSYSRKYKKLTWGFVRK